eukprot:Rmarinus@m.7880
MAQRPHVQSIEDVQRSFTWCPPDHSTAIRNVAPICTSFAFKWWEVLFLMMTTTIIFEAGRLMVTFYFHQSDHILPHTVSLDPPDGMSESLFILIMAILIYVHTFIVWSTEILLYRSHVLPGEDIYEKVLEFFTVVSGVFMAALSTHSVHIDGTDYYCFLHAMIRLSQFLRIARVYYYVSELEKTYSIFAGLVGFDVLVSLTAYGIEDHQQTPRATLILVMGFAVCLPITLYLVLSPRHSPNLRRIAPQRFGMFISTIMLVAFGLLVQGASVNYTSNRDTGRWRVVLVVYTLASWWFIYAMNRPRQRVARPTLALVVMYVMSHFFIGLSTLALSASLAYALNAKIVDFEEDLTDSMIWFSHLAMSVLVMSMGVFMQVNSTLRERARKISDPFSQIIRASGVVIITVLAFVFGFFVQSDPDEMLVFSASIVTIALISSYLDSIRFERRARELDFLLTANVSGLPSQDSGLGPNSRPGSLVSCTKTMLNDELDPDADVSEWERIELLKKQVREVSNVVDRGDLLLLIADALHALA